jgi:plasmid stabilization system protein ParE
MVARPPELHPEAINEAEAGLLWYLERSRSAAEQFLVALDRAVDQVREAPERWPRYVAGTRRYVMLKFPYVLVYKVVQGDVYVYAVAHAKRKPGYWRERLSWKGATRD